MCLVCKDESCTICRTNKVSQGLLKPFTHDELCDIGQFRDMPDDGQHYEDDKCTQYRYRKPSTKLTSFSGRRASDKQTNLQFMIEEMTRGISPAQLWEGMGEA